MARATADAPLTTRAARERLAAQHRPYWRGIEGGAAIGYRKGTRGGQWLVRVTDGSAGGGYRQASLAKADDALPADGTSVLDWRQADKAAREWILRHNRVAAGLEPEAAKGPVKPFTVGDAVTEYLADFQARGGKSVSQTRQSAAAHIMPVFESVLVGRLTREKVKSWHRALASAQPRLRSKAGETNTRVADPLDTDAPRRRRASANRVLTILKAALNHARAEGKATCPDDAWAAVKPFRGADAPKVRYLLDGEITRLLNACPHDFRQLVTGALLTGCRYGELTKMTAIAFDPQVGMLTVSESKGGKPRHVVLTDEGRAFFARQVTGRTSDAPMFEHDVQVQSATRNAPAGKQRRIWGHSHQFRLLREACSAANIAPMISFHILRHTYASRLAMNGAPLPVIAKQLGHADTRMTEKHYAHMAPSYIADTIRASFGPLGINIEADNVMSLRMPVRREA